MIDGLFLCVVIVVKLFVEMFGYIGKSRTDTEKSLFTNLRVSYTSKSDTRKRFRR